jgi:hypothetical protein
MESPVPICMGCAHFIGTIDLDVGPTCEAFLAGIPAAIWDDSFDHRQPFEGDGGVRFELVDTDDARRALRVYENGVAYAASQGGD